MNPFKKLKAYLTLREAIRQADEAYEKGNHRFYVVPSLDGKLLIIDRKNFRVLKHKKYISQDASINDLLYTCFYATPYGNRVGVDEEVLKMKREKYYEWYNNTH